MKKLFLLFLSFSCASVYANCPGRYFSDTGICQIIGNNGEVINYNSSSPANGKNTHQKERTTYINIPPKYGAYANNPKTGQGSGVLNKSSLKEAKKEAIKACEDNGKNAPCKVVKWIRNGCIAVAKGRLSQSDNKWEGFFAGEAKGKAEFTALEMCKKEGFKDCQVAVPEGCSLPDTM